jgi:glycolate oxidase FAD binding subunit
VTGWDGLAGVATVREAAPGDAIDGVVPARVVAPADVSGVRRCVAAVAAAHGTLVAAGRGRHLDIGAVPRRLDAILRLDRLDRVVAHEPADLTVTVEAGVTLAALDRALEPAGQWLPLDPPCPEETTVGGLVAANLSGALRASHGTVRDWLIGIAVVAADGALVRGGGRVVKNVAGYDLPKLHVGALGTLGVIVEATFKVRPRPRREEAVVIEVPELAAAAELALAIRDGVEPSWLELVHPAALLDGSPAAALILAGVAGPSDWVDDALGRVQRVAEPYAIRRRSDGGALRRRASELAVRPAAAIVRVAGLPADVGRAMAPVYARLRAGGRAVDLTVHVANGVARVAVAGTADVEPVLDAFRSAAPRHAWVVLERARPLAKRGLDVWGRLDTAAGARLMARVKRTFDPNGVLAPGRFVADS